MNCGKRIIGSRGVKGIIGMLCLCFSLCFSLASADNLPIGIILVGDQSFRSTLDGAEMLRIPGGLYAIGNQNGRYDEKPEIKVRVSSFLMDKKEVSNKQFEDFITSSGYIAEGPYQRGYPPKGEHLPVRFVSYKDAVSYARFVKRRLPTEVEWEIATGGRVFPFAKNWKPGIAVVGRTLKQGPLPVFQNLDKSLFGILNMGGNVREWVSDWYDRYQYRSLAKQAFIQNPKGPQDHSPPEEIYQNSNTVPGNERSTRRVVRSASFTAQVRDASRASKRGAQNPMEWFNDLGFRCALGLEDRP
jgi:formylglycine-generating enzyme required for sulfatase activity